MQRKKEENLTFIIEILLFDSLNCDIDNFLLCDIIGLSKGKQTKNKKWVANLPPKKGFIMMNGIVLEKPESILKINRAFVMAFLKTVNDEEKNWIVETLLKANEEKGEKSGFMAFRVEFAKRYFPEIVKGKKKRLTLAEEMEQYLSEVA